MKENSSIHLSIRVLESIAKKTLDLGRHPDIKLHVEQCETCAAYLKTLEDQANAPASKPLVPEIADEAFDKTIIMNVPPRPFHETLHDLRRHPWKVRPAIVLPLVLALVIGAILFFKPPFLKGNHSFKADPSFLLQVNGDTVGNKTAVIRCRGGDTLRFTTKRPRPFYYYILFQDDGGPIRRYYPDAADTADLLDKDGSDLLPCLITLDDAWRKKTLFCILKDGKFSFLEAVVIVNRYLRKELPNDRPQIETFYLHNITSSSPSSSSSQTSR